MGKGKNKSRHSRIKRLIELAEKLTIKRSQIAANKINRVYAEKIKDSSYIEHIFDELLDIAYVNPALSDNLFSALYSYYKDIDFEASEFYKEKYLEISNEVREDEPHQR